MLRPLIALFLVAASCGAAFAGGAGGECDCDRRVGLCEAEAISDGTRITFTSQTEQCSRLSFSLGGEPASITIRHGRGVAAFSTPKGEVPVEACYVCDVAATR